MPKSCYFGILLSFIDFHNHIIELVKWANENNILNTTLANFVIDHKWEELEALKNGELVNVNFDAVKIV